MFNQIFMRTSQPVKITKGLNYTHIKYSLYIFFLLTCKIKNIYIHKMNKKKRSSIGIFIHIYHVRFFVSFLFFIHIFRRFEFFFFHFHWVSYTNVNLNANKCACFEHEFIVVEQHVIRLCIFHVEKIHFNTYRMASQLKQTITLSMVTLSNKLIKAFFSFF